MNNYDKSSSGENIELNISYDTSLATMYFDEWLDGSSGENVERIDLGGRDNYLYLIGDSADSYYKKSALNKMSKAELIELDNNYQLLQPYDTKECKKSEYIAELQNVTIKKHYEYLASQYSWHEMSDNCPHDSYVSRGYSQGDAVIIVKIDGLTPGYKKYIDNLFWDCPITGIITVDNNDFYIDELLDDYYQWDLYSVKSKVNELPISDYAKSFICDNLPDYPNYN